MTNDENTKEGLYFMKKDIWQRSFRFGIRVIRMCQVLPRGIVSQEITRQIVRSSMSIAANISEGSAGSSKKEFGRYQNIARKSALETYNRLLFIEEIFRYESRMRLLKVECEEIVKILTTIVLNTKNNS